MSSTTTNPPRPGSSAGSSASETDVKTKAREAADATRTAARDAAETAKQEARDLADTAKQEAMSHADSAKGAVADEVSGVASALRTAAQDMREGSAQERTFGQIAEGLADAADSLREKDLGEMARDVSNFARRNPLAFLGGAALVGFAATRFAKASSEKGSNSGSNDRRDASHPETSYGQPLHGTAGTSGTAGTAGTAGADSHRPSSTGSSTSRPGGVSSPSVGGRS